MIKIIISLIGKFSPKNKEEDNKIVIYYNRNAAVNYARTWWNGRNPNYPSFSDDCTNFISQCLFAGGAPMSGFSNRARGWWITDGWKRGIRNGYYSNETWSFSWTVSQSLKNYLDTSKSGLTAKRVDSPSQLEIGDIIFYDFQGDGRIDHSTIVTSMINGEPYIHAHTVNSADRYYDYSNSYAYTPNTKYYFYKIDDIFT